MIEFRKFDNGINNKIIDKELIHPLNLICKNFIIQDDEISSISLGIFFNHLFDNLKKEYSSKDAKYNILDYNFPNSLSGKQYEELKKCKQQIITLLNEQNLIKLQEANIENISIMFLFNKSFNDIKIKGINTTDTDVTKEKTTEDEFLFAPSEPKYKLNQVILNSKLEKEIKKTLTILKKRELIYTIWGFSEIEPSPKAILNFYGPSGTGKTMTAQAIADHLQLKIMALNYADIESKFVGDAPKNLVKAFEIAERENALLFFDEADSFLGKRITNISSSSDQAVNSLRSQLLILLENFEGIVIFATNLMKNYDKAFESRIFKHLKFDLPDKENRIKIIKKTIPTKLPFKDNIQLSEDEIENIAEISEGLSGRHIKNAVLSALTNAVLDERDYVEYDDFYESFENMTKTMNDNNNSDVDFLQDKKNLERKISSNLRSRRKYSNRVRKRQ